MVAGVDRSRCTIPSAGCSRNPASTAHGTRRLDDALGPWFAVLSLAHDPSMLDGDSIVWWRSIGACFVHVASPRCHVYGERSPVGDDGDVLTITDVDGAFRDWRRARPGDEVVVLRPDRYVAATCARRDLATVTGALRARLGEGDAG